MNGFRPAGDEESWKRFTRRRFNAQIANEQSREVVEQAKEDTEHGLRDTDLRGIPSDIVASDLSSGDNKKKK